MRVSLGVVAASVAALALHVTAYDGANLESAHANTAATSTPAGSSSQTFTFTTTGDATIQQASPTTNAGSASPLIVDNSPVDDVMMKFNVATSGCQSLTSAKLTLTNDADSSVKGGDFYTTGPNWTESTVNWSNAPTRGALLNSLGAVASGATATVDVTQGVSTLNGEADFRIGSTSSNGVHYFSKEGNGAKPTLTVVCATSAPTPDTQAPTVPANLTGSAKNSGEVDLSWTASTDNIGVTNYDIYRGGTLVGTVPGGTTQGSSLTYQDTTVAATTTYSYTVKARDAANNASPASNTATVTTPAASVAPTAPSGLTATATSSTSVSLSWTATDASGTVTGYNIYRGPQGGTLAKISSSGTSSYTDTTAVAGTAYNYAVTAVATGGAESAKSNTATVTTPGGVTKVLTFIEENHSLSQMQAGMPYLYSLAQRYAYANNYSAITHPSEPNYVALAFGSTMGDAADHGSAQNFTGPTVFGAALNGSRIARSYIESMGSNCQLTDAPPYYVKHNPWPDAADERSLCAAGDIPSGSLTAGALHDDITTGALPTVGLVVPNICNDAHDCSLATADTWLKGWLEQVFTGPDWQAGRLAIVVTADEDDQNSGNKVLTAVITPQLDGTHKIVTTALNHYSWTRMQTQVAGVPCIRSGCTAADMIAAFGITLGAQGAPQTDTQPPTAPTNLVATPTSSTSVALTWTASTDNVGVMAYDIYRDAGATAIGSTAATTFTDNGVSASTLHSYVVKARDAASNTSGPSNTASVTTPGSGGGGGITAGTAAVTKVTAAATSWTVSLPSFSGGEFMVVWLGNNLGSTAGTPASSGWTAQVTTNESSGLKGSFLTRRMVAGDPTSITVSWGGSTLGVAEAVAFTGVNAATPVDVKGGQAEASTTAVASHSTPSVTTTAAGDVLVSGFTTDNASTWTSGDTELADAAATVSASMYYSASVPAGSYSRSATATAGSVKAVSAMLALKAG